MTVEELIELLSGLDKKTLVVLDGYEGGLRDCTDVEKISMIMNVNTVWYYGPHEESSEGNVTAYRLR